MRYRPNRNFRSAYKNTRSRKVYKNKPYMWRMLDDDYGDVFAFDNFTGNGTISFTGRNNKAYTGWDIDRQRFMVKPYKRFTPMFRGTWKYEMWNHNYWEFRKLNNAPLAYW